MDAATVSSIISVLVLVAVGLLYVLNMQIHKLVNSRLTEALDSIESLQKQVQKLGGPKAPPPRDRGESE